MPELSDFYRMHYQRVFNLGNYESEHIEVVRDFPNTTPKDVALLTLKDDVEKATGKNTNPTQAKTPADPMSEAQHAAIYAIAKSKGVTEAQIKAKIFGTFKVKEIKDLSKLQASALIDALQKQTPESKQKGGEK